MTSSLAGWTNGLLGLLLDQQWGLLIHAPVYALVGAGAVALAQRWPAALGWLLLVVVPYYAFIGAYNQWWGEWCPPARYLTTLAPLAAAPLGALWGRDRTPITALLTVALSVPGAAVMLAFLADPQLMYNHPIGRSMLLLALSERNHVSYTLFVPSFVAPAPGEEILQRWWAGGLATLVLLTTLATFEYARPPARLEKGLSGR
jgi:hypothetical protein